MTVAAFPFPTYPSKCQQDEPEFLTDIQTYQDGGQDYLLQNDNPIRRWTIEFENLTPDEAATLDAHYESAGGRTLGFSFTDPESGITYADVHYERYDRSNGQKRHIKNRSIRLSRRPRAASVDFVGLYSLPVAIGNCELWLPGDRIGVDPDSQISSWNDISGNARHASQPDANYLPTYRESRVGGLPAVEFRGTVYKKFMNLPNFMTGFTAGEAFFVAQADAYPPAVADYLMSWGYEGNGTRIRADGQISDSFGTDGIIHNSGTPVADLSQPFLYNPMSKAGNWRLRINGATQYNVNSNTVRWNTLPRIAHDGIGLGLGDTGFQGAIAEIVFFSRELNSRERAMMNRYFREKYAIDVLVL